MKLFVVLYPALKRGDEAGCCGVFFPDVARRQRGQNERTLADANAEAKLFLNGTV